MIYTNTYLYNLKYKIGSKYKFFSPKINSSYLTKHTPQSQILKGEQTKTKTTTIEFITTIITLIIRSNAFSVLLHHDLVTISKSN
jgi:hypothetical protein